MSHRPKYYTETEHYGGYLTNLHGPQPPAPPLPPPSLADLLTARPTGLTEPECWAILCQSVQALQDLFLSDGVSSDTCIPLVTPSTLILLSRGRVKLYQSGTTMFGCVGLPATAVHLTGYLAPEYRPNKHYTDTETEKMWIYALGETLKRAVLLHNNSNNNTLRLSNELYKILNDMTKPQTTMRASLMYLLDVISEYCKKRQQNRPFSHIVMDLHQEAMVVVEMRLDTPWGPPAMPELRPRTVNKCDTNTTIPRRWISLTRMNQDNTNRPIKFTKEASTSMEDLCLSNNNNNHHNNINTPGRIVRPKSLCVPDMMTRYLNEPLPPQPTKKFNTLDGNRRLKLRRNPVQRAASRLYRANPTDIKMNDKRNCIGPEFVVRASLPSKQIVIPDIKNSNNFNKRIVTVIMLNGQKLDVVCNPNSTTAGELFEMIIQKEHVEENFMLGLSALIAGDFVFLPFDTRICKAIQSDNSIDNNTSCLTLFMRVRFFLPNLRGIRNQQTKHLLYLQLRRSILEHQLPCSFTQLVELNGLALQAEFGDFNEKEHGIDYFLIEHYIPETMSCRIDDLNQFRQELIRSHFKKIGLSEEKAKEDFIILAQSLPHYGGHFYTATWILKDNNQKDVWLYISSKGINLYERDRANLYGPQLYEIFEWRTIQTLCYSKHYLCILPHLKTTSSKLKKYKLKMDHKKSYFTFRLASLHHQFFLRLRTEYTSLQNLSNQFGIPLKDMKNETNTLHKLENFNGNHHRNDDDLDRGAINAETEFKIDFCTPTKPSNDNNNRCRRVKSIQDITIINQEENENFVNYQKFNNHINEGATSLIIDSCYLAGLNPHYNNNNTDKRSGVKMGTRMFKNRVSRSMETMNLLNNNNNNINNNLDDMSLQSVSINYSSTSPLSGNDEPLSVQQQAFIIDAKTMTNQEFLPDLHETINQTLIDKFDNLSYTEEYQMIKVTLERKNYLESLGLQIVEGSDGNVYVQNVIKNSLSDLTGNILNGDQIIAVNGENLLNRKYLDCLELLKSIKTNNIEFILSRIVTKRKLSNTNNDDNIEKHLTENCQDFSNLNKYGTNEIVPYLKHIRYEIESDMQNLMLRQYIPGTVVTTLNRTLSKSCTQINENRSQQQQQQRCRIIDMIPKTNYYSLDRKSTIPPIALPRSLGLSRKYRGPVRYPVTPVKYTNDGGAAATATTTTTTTTSDDEQVFI